MDNTDIAIVDVICPKCEQKTYFKSSWIKAYKSKPAPNGIITCTKCGLAKPYLLSDLKYYYAIKVGDRYLIARTRNDFINLYTYFKENRRWNDSPDLDFPKTFYINRDILIKKLNNFWKMINIK